MHANLLCMLVVVCAARRVASKASKAAPAFRIYHCAAGSPTHAPIGERFDHFAEIEELRGEQLLKFGPLKRRSHSAGPRIRDLADGIDVETAVHSENNRTAMGSKISALHFPG